MVMRGQQVLKKVENYRDFEDKYPKLKRFKYSNAFNDIFAINVHQNLDDPSISALYGNCHTESITLMRELVDAQESSQFREEYLTEIAFHIGRQPHLALALDKEELDSDEFAAICSKILADFQRSDEKYIQDFLRYRVNERYLKGKL